MSACPPSEVPDPSRRTQDRTAAGVRPVPEETPGRNTAATVGLVLGVVSLVVNPVLLMGIGAVGVSAFGFNRAALMGQFGYAPIGKRKAVLGVLLGLLGILESVVFKGSLF